MRGGLINPVLAELAQLDTAATAADPDGAGSLASGYDDDFREVVKVPVANVPAGASARQEKDLIRVPAQVMSPDAFDAMRMFPAGNIPDFSYALVFHFADLESLGLVDSNGLATIVRNDRLVAIYDCFSENLIERYADPPGLYVTEARPVSYGLSGGTRNLLLVTFDDREQGLSRTT